MRFATRLFVALCFAFSTGAGASTYSSEITDMWWNSAESGWGVNVILQANTAFVTFFVYDPNQNPVWYTAQVSANSGSIWTGPLYVTRGPWFGGPFPPTTTIRQAGTATFNLTSLDTATLTYSVDGVAVTKSLTRQTWTNEDFSGTYAGGYSIRLSACNPASVNGLQEVAGPLAVNHSGTAFTMTSASTLGNCNFNGSYSQAGKLGLVSGTYSCTDGTVGNFQMVEMTPTVNGFTARMSGQNQACQWSGFVGGIRRAQ